MIDITATAASVKEAKVLLEIGIDTLLIGEETFGLRLPHSFSRDEQQEIIGLAHAQGRKVSIAVNGIMHPDKMQQIPEYLGFLAASGADQIVAGDPGVVYVLQKENLPLPYIYDGETLVTSARQINFWGARGALGAVLAREVPYLEMVEMKETLTIFGEVLVYGATCIHQSKRPLVSNYLAYIKADEAVSKERGLFLSEPEDDDSHYSVYEDSHGTHIFANHDVNLMMELDKLSEAPFDHWKLDGLYCGEASFLVIAQQFVRAKEALTKGTWSREMAEELNEIVRREHPAQRGLDTGFFYLQPDDVK